MTAVIAWKSHTDDAKVASFRLRALKACKNLKEAGLNCEHFEPTHLKHYKLVIFQKAFSDNDLEIVKQLKSNGCITAFDICDNHFYDPHNDPVFAKRAEKLQAMIDAVDYVIVSTPTLAEYIQKDPDKIFQIDDYIDAPEKSWIRKQYAEYALNREFKKHKLTNTFKIVWYGNAGIESQQFGMMDLEMVIPDLIRLNQKTPISLTVISNNTDKFNQYIGKNQPFPTLYISWKKHYFSHQLPHFDACIIPARINPFTRVKTNNRVLLALNMGLPVVASKLPSYEEFSPYITFDNWANNLFDIAQNKADYQQKVLAAQTFIDKHYSSRNVTNQWLQVFSQILPSETLAAFNNKQEVLAV